MKQIAVILCSLLIAVPTAFAQTACEGRSDTLETAENTYDVFLSGKKIGHHTIRFRKYGTAIDVDSETFMQVKVLFLSAFKYEYLAKESWCGDTLLSVDTITNSNGKDISSNAVKSGDGYNINADYNGDISETFIEGSLTPSNHWNITNLEKTALFDTIKAYNFAIHVTQTDTETDSPYSGDRYDIEGDYKYSTWYDDNSHWQGMSFYREKKHFIEFRCRDCDNTLWPGPPVD